MRKRKFRGRRHGASCGLCQHSKGTTTERIGDELEGDNDRNHAVGGGLCSSVEMELVVQTMSYINYELLIGWPWQWDVVTSLMMSQWHSGFPGDNNTPSPGVTEWQVREFAMETVGDGVASARHSK